MGRDEKLDRDDKLVSLTIAMMNGKRVLTKDLAEEFDISLVTAWRWLRKIGKFTNMQIDDCGYWYIDNIYRRQVQIEYFRP